MGYVTFLLLKSSKMTIYKVNCIIIDTKQNKKNMTTKRVLNGIKYK